MRRQIFIALLLLGFTIDLKAQNLIVNGDFETIIACPGGAFGQGITLAQPWLSALPNSPVCFNACSTNPKFGVPINADSLMGYQLPHSGSGYTGFSVYNPNSFIRVYPLIQLTDTLKAGKSYCLTFYLNLLNYSQYGIDAVGAHFSVLPDTCFGLFCLINALPQVSNPSGNILIDTLGWTKIEGCFTAGGGEKYLTIGNFNTDSATQKALNRPSFSWGTFYYLDDVSLYEDTTLRIEGIIDENEFTISPNPAKDNISLTCKSGTYPLKYSLVNIMGNTIHEGVLIDNGSTINVSQLCDGVYFMKYKLASGENGNKKFVIVSK